MFRLTAAMVLGIVFAIFAVAVLATPPRRPTWSQFHNVALRARMKDHCMNGIGVCCDCVHRQEKGARARPMERYASAYDLSDAARARRGRTEERTIDTVALRTEVVAPDALTLREASGCQSGARELRAVRPFCRRAAETAPHAVRLRSRDTRSVTDSAGNVANASNRSATA